MGNDNDNKGPIAQSRISQVAGHVAQSKKRRAVRTKDELPADYSDILGQLDSLRAIASTPDPTNKGYVRQKQAGKLWVRDRVLQLLDEGSFHEVGSVSGTVKWKKLAGIKEEPISYIPSNNVQGFGMLRGRKVVFTADDFSIRAGRKSDVLGL